MDKQFIAEKVANYQKYTIHNYRHLHQNPELSFQEYETSRYIRDQLDAIHIPYKHGIGGEGILGRIVGGKPGKTIALRADMDALPIIEKTDLPWSSRNDGAMHACGHDAHMSTLLTVARILNEIKDQLSGTILLIFQPAEERCPGGANLMLKDGLFQEWIPEVILGQHVLPGMDTGTVGIRSGLCMASADELYLDVKGIGGHAALPHFLNDTVLAASSIIVGLQQIVSRLIPAHVPAVLSFGRFIADGATNVIPPIVNIHGTLRLMDEEWRAKAKESIVENAALIAKTHGCECDVRIAHGYPCVYNDPKTYEKGKTYLADFLGKEKVEEMEIRMTAEDFGFYSQEFPSLFYRFGVTGENNKEAGGLHTPNFKIDEESFKTSVGGFAWMALKFLEEE